MELPPPQEAWNRQAEEPDQAWGCFVLFRDLSPATRSLGRAFVAYLIEAGQDIEPDAALRAPSWFVDLSLQWHWRDRVREFDEWMDAERLRSLQARRATALVEVADLGQEMRRKAMDAIRHLHTILYEEVIDEDGNLVTKAKSALSPAAIAQLAKAGVDLERFALGLEAVGTGGGVSVNIGIAAGGSSALPIPGGDDVIIARVLDIAEGRARLAKPMLAPGGHGGSGS